MMQAQPPTLDRMQTAPAQLAGVEPPVAQPVEAAPEQDMNNARPSLAPIAAAPAEERKTNRELLTEFYTKHDATKIANIDQLLVMPVDKVRAALKDRYGEAPPLEAEAPPLPAGPVSPNRSRLIEYYRQHDPKQLPKVDKILDLPHDRVVKALTNKYGVDPRLESNAQLLSQFYEQRDPSKAKPENIKNLVTNFSPRALQDSLQKKYGDAPKLMGTADVEFADDGGGYCIAFIAVLFVCLPLVAMSFYTVCFVEPIDCAAAEAVTTAAAASTSMVPNVPPGERPDTLGCFCDDMQGNGVGGRLQLAFNKPQMSMLVMGAASDIVLSQLPAGLSENIRR